MKRRLESSRPILDRFGERRTWRNAVGGGKALALELRECSEDVGVDVDLRLQRIIALEGERANPSRRSDRIT